MRKVRWQWKIILFLMFAGLFCPVKVHAEETGSYLSELSDEMDYGKLDTFLENYGVEQVSFSGLVEELMQDGVSTAWGEHVFSAIKTSLVGEIAANRKMLLEIVLLAFCFSVLKKLCGCISCVVYLGTMFSAGVLCHGSHAFADISSLSGGRVEVAGKLCGIYESHGADVLSQHDVCLKCEQCRGILPDRISGDLSGGVAVFKSADASDPYLCAVGNVRSFCAGGALFKSDGTVF